MAQSLVSNKALIREMDAEQLEEMYRDKMKPYHLSRNVKWIALKSKTEELIEIKKQYFQLTGKTLN